ncbi:glycosyltransferase [Nocardiopsis sp. NPDC055824]
MTTSDSASSKEVPAGRGAGGPEGQGTAPTDPAPAAQPRLYRNDYSPLVPPVLGGWEPTLSVSVVVPAHGHPEKLAMVLASLSAQSYPSRLMEVVVVDDGSPEPLELPRVRPENTRLLASAPGGWGSGHAFNTGAAASEGAVVLRLDSDMLVYREHVESQMRWHHLLDYAVVLGHKLFVDFDPEALDPEYVAEQVRAGRAADLFDRETADTHWIEEVVERTDGLRTAHHGAFKVFVGATGSLHRTLFEAAGGMDADLILGGDSELGHRLAQRGAVFVPDLDTSSWHLGRSQMQQEKERGTRYRGPYVSNRVPDFHLRNKRPDRQWEVPRVDIVLDVAEATLEEADTTASGLLRGTTPDVRLWLRGPWGVLDEGRRSPLDDERLDLRLVRETFRGDPRVRFTEGDPEEDPRVPFRLHVPAGAEPRDNAVANLVALLDRRGDGLFCAPLPGATRAGDGVLRLERTSAFARARHLEPEAEPKELDQLVEELFGVQWASAQAFVVADGAGPADEERAEDSAEALRHQLNQARAEAQRLRRRAERAERKLRWFTPGLGRRILRRIAR